jgi:hypothetical protein
MDPELTTVSRDAAVRADYRVRRRRYGDMRILIRRTQHYQLDQLTDSVWLACERGSTVGEIVKTVAREHGLPLADALAATVFTLEQFRAVGIVTYEVPTVVTATGREP